MTSNTLIFQMDPQIQEEWDSARRISCLWDDKYAKKVEFNPFEVSMMKVLLTDLQKDRMEMWMEIKRGNFPNTMQLKDAIHIGDPLSLEIYLQDEEKMLDLGVQDCWAYSVEKSEIRSLVKGIQLSDENGCPLRRKLISFWEKRELFLDAKRTLVSYVNITAFKFVNKGQISIKCNVQVCYGKCKVSCNKNFKMRKAGKLIESKVLHAELSVPRKFQEEKCTLPSFDPKCAANSEEVETLSSERCSSRSEGPDCAQSHIYYVAPLPRPPKCTTHFEESECQNGVVVRKQNNEESHCVPRSFDPNCKYYDARQSTASDETKCSKLTNDCRKYSTFKSLGCILNPNNPKCRTKKKSSSRGSKEKKLVYKSSVKSLTNGYGLRRNLENKPPGINNCSKNCDNQRAWNKMSLNLNENCVAGTDNPKCSKQRLRRTRPIKLSSTCFGLPTDPRCLSFSRKKLNCQTDSTEVRCLSPTESFEVTKGKLICKFRSQDNNCGILQDLISRHSKEVSNCKSYSQYSRCNSPKKEVRKAIMSEQPCGLDSRNHKCRSRKSKHKLQSQQMCETQVNHPFCLAIRTQISPPISDEENESPEEVTSSHKVVQTELIKTGSKKGSRSFFNIARTSKLNEPVRLRATKVLPQIPALTTPNPKQTYLPNVFEATMPKITHKILTYSLKPLGRKTKSKLNLQSNKYIEDNNEKCTYRSVNDKCFNTEPFPSCGESILSLKCIQTVPTPTTCAPGSSRRQCLRMAKAKRVLMTTHSPLNIRYYSFLT